MMRREFITLLRTDCLVSASIQDNSGLPKDLPTALRQAEFAADGQVREG